MPNAYLTEVARNCRESALYLLDAEVESPQLEAHKTEQGRFAEGWVEVLKQGKQHAAAAHLQAVVDRLPGVTSFQAASDLFATVARQILACETSSQEADLPAHDTTQRPDGKHSTLPVSATSTRLKACGMSAFKGIKREQTYVDGAETSPVWDGTTIKTIHPRGDWSHSARIILESATGVAEAFTIHEPENITLTRNGGAETISNGGVSDYDNEAGRPIRIWLADYLPQLCAHSHFHGNRDEDGEKREDMQSPDGPDGLADSRPGLGTHWPAFWRDSAENAADTVQPNENFQLRLSIFAAKGLTPGVYEGLVSVRDVDGGITTVPVAHTVPALDMPDQYSHARIAFSHDNMIIDSVAGDAFDALPTSPAIRKAWKDRFWRKKKMFGMTPTGFDENNNPVPSADHEPRVLGGLYSGPEYLGRGINAPLEAHMMAPYYTSRFWTGVDASDWDNPPATPPAALVAHTDAVDAWAAANNFTGPLIVALRDEVSREEDLVKQNAVAGMYPANWLKMLTTLSSSDDPQLTPIWKWMPEDPNPYPNFNLILVAANALPKRLRDMVADWKTRAPGALYGPYNGHATPDFSVMFDDDLAGGQILSGFGTAKQRPAGVQDMSFIWTVFYGIMEESRRALPPDYDDLAVRMDGADPSHFKINDGTVPGVTTPADGFPRMNVNKTPQTIGTNEVDWPWTPILGQSGHLHSQLDGYLFKPGRNVYHTEADSGYPQTDTLRIGEACFGIGMRQAIIEVAELARVKDAPATDAAIKTVVPDDYFGYELGTKGDMYPDESPNQEYSHNAGLRPLNTIDRHTAHTGFETLIGIAQ